MKWVLLVACVVLMTEVNNVRSGGAAPTVSRYSSSCTTGQLVGEKQDMIECFRRGRAQEKNGDSKNRIMLDTFDCIIGNFRSTGSDGVGVSNLRSSDLLANTGCTNACRRRYLQATGGCKYQDFFACLTRCFHRRIDYRTKKVMAERKRRSASVPDVFNRVEYMECYLPCVTPKAVMTRSSVPIPANPGCSVDDHVRSATCRNMCLTRNRFKRSVFEDAAKGVPALVNLMNSHCVSDCLEYDYLIPQSGSCELLDVEQFEYCLNICILKTDMLLQPPPPQLPPPADVE